MKNISRRVFIKGLAVAGVAAAASTVLAGCNTNMIPGVDDGAEDPTEEPSSTNTITWKDPADNDNTLSITVSGISVSTLATDGSDVVLFTTKVVNDLGGADVTFATAAPTSSLVPNDYYVHVTSYLNGEKGTTATVNKAATTYRDNLLDVTGSANVISGNADSKVTKNGNIVATVTKGTKWSKIAVKLDVYKAASAASTQLVGTKAFEFSK